MLSMPNVTSCITAPGSAAHMQSARVQEPNFIWLYSWAWSIDSMVHRRNNFEVRRSSRSVDDTLSVSAVSGVVTLTFDLFTLKLVRIIVCRCTCSLPINFAVSGTFLSRLMGQHPSDGPRDLVTMTFDFGGHSADRDVALHVPIVYQVRSS